MEESTVEKYNTLKSYLNGLEMYPSEDELDEIIGRAVQQDGYEANKGYKHERVKDNPREMAFYEQWLKENEPRRYINNGQGILQDLFIERDGFMGHVRRYEVEINNRDRYIVATIIQWLGSNVGMGFLHSALARFNAHIVEK